MQIFEMEDVLSSQLIGRNEYTYFIYFYIKRNGHDSSSNFP